MIIQLIMKKYKFKKIDAFTNGQSSGNPAGCIYVNKRNEISDDEMQLIARELKGFVNEVVYLFPESDGCFLKYYSSECEVAKEASNQNNNFRTRVFAPKYGYLEDPATGSGNSAFGCYLLNKKSWDTAELTIEQNNSHDFPNIVKLRTIKKDGKTFVAFGGKAIVKIEGDYIID